jgi:hypothetical protein
VHFIGQRLPLEKVLRLRHPDEDDEPPRTTTREFSLDGPPPKKKERKWTTDDVLVSYALQQNFVTAKVGRPDIYRAGASILRLLHSSAIPWGFRPPPSPFESWPLAKQEGVWFEGFTAQASKGGEREEGASEEEEDGEESEEAEGSESDTEEDSADEKAVQAVRGAFAALAVEEGEDDDEDEEETSEDDGSADESDVATDEGEDRL